jgi:hypothetical protein
MNAETRCRKRRQGSSARPVVLRALQGANLTDVAQARVPKSSPDGTDNHGGHESGDDDRCRQVDALEVGSDHASKVG